ncbi:ABC transporter substrate-binding protein [Streptomyces cyaneochromogenes]|uniref:ABC transporter substrate-binding protein n=1 Tax=Streptomyces cyaneochromogenes TaxID=2496836 RepID=A0A3Q9EWQ8_9ACTN|nr:ABC transporter substrate-binding protein [Streptomyces cyaneochromogenes]AZQ37189.1 ABC transporter substrate-binding protein [Streptomyces cyaneochromogenes]
MSIFRNRTTTAALVAVAAGALTLTACGGGGGSSAEDNSKSKEDAKSQSKPVQIGDEKASTGPAAEVPGAKAGGTAIVYQEADFSHLDPGQIYVSDGKLLSRLIYRGLTQYAEDDKGNLTVVGDLATDAGKVSDGGKTWTYTLKPGLKDENGNPINSADIRHSVERLYSTYITDGPSYLQQWLSGSGTTYRDAYAGPDKGKHLPDSVLETPDEKTVVFHFKDAQPDLPQMLTMPGYSVVPEETDTKEKYDTDPVATGPYKIADFKPGKSMKLVKNTQWDPKSDSVRHQYVDGFDIEMNHDDEDQTKTLLADQGDAKNAMMFTGQVATTQLQAVVGDKSVLGKRTIEGYAPYVWQLNFNLDRVKDKKLRDAITLALPATSVFKADGGAYGGEVANSLMSPTTPGYDEKYDPFNRAKKPNGDIEAAKKLIEEGGFKGKKLVYAYGNTPVRQQQAVLIADALEKIGLDIQKKEIDSATWYEQVGKVKNGYDLYMTGWGQDWSSAATVFPPLYDGTQIQDGASNYSHINDEHVNSEIARIVKITDTDQATKAWDALNKYISEKVNPAAPIYYTKVFQIFGSNIGGIRYSSDSSYVDVTRVFLKK